MPEVLRVDIDDLLAKAEQFYRTNIETKFADTGQNKSFLDKYKMEIYLLYQTGGLLRVPVTTIQSVHCG